MKTEKPRLAVYCSRRRHVIISHTIAESWRLSHWENLRSNNAVVTLWNIVSFLWHSCCRVMNIVKASGCRHQRVCMGASDIRGRGQRDTRLLLAPTTALLLFARVTRPVVTQRSPPVHTSHNCCRSEPTWSWAEMRDTDRLAMSAIRRRCSSPHASNDLWIRVSVCLCSGNRIVTWSLIRSAGWKPTALTAGISICGDQSWISDELHIAVESHM